MSNNRILFAMCRWLCDERARLRQEIPFAKDALAGKPSDNHVGQALKEKERKFALITEDAIQKYHALWVSLGPHVRYPCPACFVFYDERSPLIALPEENGLESVKCHFCKEVFILPSP